MGCAKPIAQNLLVDLPIDADAVPSQPMPLPKPKRIKKAQPKAKAVEAEDSLPISKLAESKKTSSAPAKRSAETQPSESTQSKRPRSASATTSGSKKPDVPWAPKLTLEDRPIMSTESANDINVGVTLSTILLLPSDLERNAGYSEYENYALMLQHSVQMKKLEDQAEAATKAQQIAEEKAESAEAIRKVTEAENEEFKSKMAQAEKELQKALATKKAEIKEADEKAYAQDDSPLRNAEAVPLSFPPLPPPSQAEEESESEPEAEDEDNDDGDALVRKPKDAGEIQSLPQDDQILDLTHEEDEEVIKEATPEQASSDVPPTDDSLNQTLAEIDAEIMAEKAAEVAFQEPAEVQIQIAPDAEES
ncbi:otolith matrix protein OMM-64-like [Camellia sinensis]|uniref:otolith matrix protein OMM-64-like n=1 Tax=Camellia sinensis TaxID=4442 RepID=UPI001036A937|nr:otolith matrix protein OMM-64-like [Camellia sinensis]